MKTNEDRSIIVEEYDGKTAYIQIKYEHVVNALAMYIQTFPFGLSNQTEVDDIDLGLAVDEDGYIGMDVTFKNP